MSDPSLFRAALCQRRATRVIAIVIALAGCGGAVASPTSDASPSSGPSAKQTGCPSKQEIDTGAVVGAFCSATGTYCPSPGCDPCQSNCAAVACTNGEWTRAVNTADCTTAPEPVPGVDASVCITIDPTTYDQTCTVDADCMMISAGTYCSNAAWCTCGGTVINVSGKARYDAEMNEIQTTLRPGQGGCFCPYFGKPTCLAGTCTLCGGPNPCPDAG